jgi:DNA invertase Pin-like site-specific DNA recombinase
MITAVAYVRMSSDKQDASPAQQREAMVRLAAKHGATIVREYFDSGISGDATEKRTAFLKMREDAAAGAFSLVLCWHTNRFGRFDVLDAGYWLKPFRDAGVTLITEIQGVIDWNSYAGRIVYSVHQEGDHQYLHDLAMNAVRGQLAAFRAGRWLGGRHVPLGYRVEVGRLVMGALADVRRARKLFLDYASGAWSLFRLAEREGMSETGIRHILRNPLYRGLWTWGRYARGTKARIVAGQPAPVPKGAGRGWVDPSCWEAIERPDLAIVDEDTWNRVQQMLADRRQAKSPAQDRTYLFSGFLWCAECGAKMHGLQTRDRPRYRCAPVPLSPHPRRVVHESVLRRAAVEAIETNLLAPEMQARMKAEYQKRLEQGTDAAEAKRLDAEIAKLRAKIDADAEKWLDAPPELTEAIGRKMQERRAALAAVEARRKALRPLKPIDLDAALGRMAEWAKRLHTAPATPELAALLRATFERVTVGEDRLALEFKPDVLPVNMVYTAERTPVAPPPGARRSFHGLTGA